MEYKFHKSIELARADYDPNAKTRCQVFSYVWYGNRVVAMGRNSHKTHPLNIRNKLKFDDGQELIDRGTCSELSSFLRLKNRTNIPYKKITLVNIRIDKGGRICNSRPCVSCQSLLRYIGIKKVYYTNQDGKFERYHEKG